MTTDILMDAIGMVDDRFLTEEAKPRTVSFRRRAVVLIAAALLVMLTAGTAMAVSDEFREIVFSIFRIETPEVPPVTEVTGTENTGDGLREMGIAEFDGTVTAHYFQSEGYVMVLGGAFYTSAWPENGAVPADPAFREITPEGIREVPATRVDFRLTRGEKTWRIVFDYAVINGKLYEREWPQGLDEDPIGNGWVLEPIPGRTDTAVLTVAERVEIDGTEYYSQRPLLLDLETLETADMLEGLPIGELAVDWYWFTGDLRRGILTGTDGTRTDYWYWDLDQGTLTSLEMLTGAPVTQAYFLNDDTVICRQNEEDGTTTIIRWHIPSGVRTTVVDHATGYRSINRTEGVSRHGLLEKEDGSLELIDLSNGIRLQLTGLDARGLTASESPDSENILLAWKGEGTEGYTALGLLDPDTGVLQLLSRQAGDYPENIIGWLDSTTVVLNAQDEGSGYYIYVYEFDQ